MVELTELKQHANLACQVEGLQEEHGEQQQLQRIVEGDGFEHEVEEADECEAGPGNRTKNRPAVSTWKKNLPVDQHVLARRVLKGKLNFLKK